MSDRIAQVDNFWVGIKSIELVRTVHLFDAVKGDLMRVAASGKTYILNCHVFARNGDIQNDYVYLSLWNFVDT